MAPSKKAISAPSPDTTKVHCPSTHWSANADTTPVMCEVYCPTAKKPPALVAPATKHRVKPSRTLAWCVRCTSTQPRSMGNMAGLGSVDAHARLGAWPGVQHVNARLGLLVGMAGGQHHAFAHTKFHFARRQVGHHHRELADQFFGFVHGRDAAEHVAGAAFAHVQGQAQQL